MGTSVSLHKHHLLRSLLPLPRPILTLAFHPRLPLSSIFSSILVPTCQKLLILVSIFPANSDSASDSSFLVHRFEHSTIHTSSPPFQQQSMLPLRSLLTPLPCKLSIFLTVLPWDDLSATESSIQRTCLSFYQLP